MTDKPKLLIVEDDSGFARTLKRSFERRGYGVAVSASLDEVRALLEQPDFAGDETLEGATVRCAAPGCGDA